MQALLFAFAYFFSAAWTYEDHCRNRHGRRQKKLLRQVNAVYKALALNPGGDTDATLNSMQLKVIGERSTKRWGEAEAQPISVAAFEAELNNNPSFGEYFKPVKEFLLKAGPDTEARARMEATGEAATRAAEKLTKKRCRP